jgi:hypothetical protein
MDFLISTKKGMKKKSLDWVRSAGFAKLDLRFDVALAFGTLHSARDLWKDIFWFTELFAEMLIVK